MKSRCLTLLSASLALAGAANVQSETLSEIDRSHLTNRAAGSRGSVGGDRASFLNARRAKRNLKNQRQKEHHRKGHKEGGTKNVQQAPPPAPPTEEEEGGASHHEEHLVQHRKKQEIKQAHKKEREKKREEEEAGAAVAVVALAGENAEAAAHRDSIAGAVSKRNKKAEQVRKKKPMREEGHGKSGKSSEHHHHDTHYPTMHHYETPAPSSTKAPSSSHHSKSGKQGKTKTSKSAKAKTHKPTPTPTDLFPTSVPTDLFPTSYPTKEDTMAPTSIPPGATFFDSFEKATFPSDPEWSVVSDEIFEGAALKTAAFRPGDVGTHRDKHGETPKARTLETVADFSDVKRPKSRPDDIETHRQGGRRRLDEEGEDSSIFWALTKLEADTGVYSIKSPDLSSEDNVRRSAYVHLNTDFEEEGFLTFSLLWDLDYPGADLYWRVDGKFYGWVPADNSTEWTEFKIRLFAGVHTVTWEYEINPKNYENPPEAGVAFLDNVYFAPENLPTYYPTDMPTGDDYYEDGDDALSYSMSYHGR